MAERKKVAMCGFAATNFDKIKTYYGIPNFEIWGINQLYKLLPETLSGNSPFSRWFQIHHKERFLEWDVQQVEKLKALDIPVYMVAKHPDIPKSVEYPRHDICTRPEFQDQYFTNCFCWMLALAYVEDFDEVHIIGCDMMLDHEIFDQRRAIEYFIGLLRGAGKTVVVSSANDLMKHYTLYGYDDDDSVHKKVFHEVQRRNKEKGVVTAHLEQSKQALHQFIGAKDALLDIGYKDEEKFKTIETEIMRLYGQVQNDEKNIAKLNGMIEQTKYFEKVWMNRSEINEKL